MGEPVDISGAFSVVTVRSHDGPMYHESTSDRSLLFNAHNSNSIYTDNGNVRPLSLVLDYIIKY